MNWRRWRSHKECWWRRHLGFCLHHQCQFWQGTGHQLRCVPVNFAARVCKIGLGCVPECPWACVSQVAVRHRMRQARWELWGRLLIPVLLSFCAVGLTAWVINK